MPLNSTIVLRTFWSPNTANYASSQSSKPPTTNYPNHNRPTTHITNDLPKQHKYTSQRTRTASERLSVSQAIPSLHPPRQNVDISYREGITVVSSHDVIFKLNFHLISYLPIDLSLSASSQRVQGAESIGAIRFARYAGIVELSSTVNMVRTDEQTNEIGSAFTGQSASIRLCPLEATQPNKLDSNRRRSRIRLCRWVSGC